MFEELETVILTHSIDSLGLREGAMGAIVHVHDGGRGYEVEFVDSVTGRTIALTTLTSADIRPCTRTMGMVQNVPVVGYSIVGAPFYSALERVVPTPSLLPGTAMLKNTKSNEDESKAMAYYQTT